MSAADREPAASGTANSGESAFLHEIDEAVREGVLVELDETWEFVVDEVVGPGIELGHLESRSPCRYSSHRGREWRTNDGRLVCAVCHPPVSGAEAGE